MTTPTPGTIPALTQYQPGGLPLAGTEALEIVSTTNATAAASFYILLTDLVGKAAGALGSVNPTANDLIAFYQHSTGLPRSTSVGNLGIPAGNLPTGGLVNQVLTKNSSTNFDASWQNPAALVTPALRVAASSTSVSMLSTDIEIGIDVRTVSAVVTLPAVSAWAASNIIGLPACIVDIYGNALTNNITLAASTTDTFLYGGVTPVINANFGNIELRPVLGTALGTTINSWYIRGIN